jgi:hypothetical protein
MEDLTRLSPELLTEFGFEKIGYIDEDSGIEKFHYELPLSKTTYCDFLLLSNANDEPDFPIVQFCGVDEYEFHHAEPLVLLMNILQSVCVVEGLQIDQQFNNKPNEESGLDQIL